MLRLRSLWFGAWCLLGSACTANSPAGNPADNGTPGAGGFAGGSGSAAGGSAAVSGAPPTAGTGASDACATPDQPNAPVLHARLLTPSQYDHVIEDLVGVTGNPAKDFGGGVAASLDDVAVEHRADAASSIAAQAVANLSKWSPCVPPAVDAATCETKLIDQLGRAAFKHPLEADERTQLKALFDAGVAQKDFATGLEWFLTGLLQSPDFLYQFAKPAAGEQAGKVVPLAPYEIANRLALFIWDGAADDGLFAAADSGGLNDATGVAAQVQRLMSDPRFARGTESFYRGWLRLDSFKEVARNDPGLTTDVVAALQHSVLLSATSLYSAAAPNIESLFQGESYFLDSQLRAFYGMGGGSATYEATAMPNEQRHGILTHPGLMTLLARPGESNPISRGLFVQRTVLCHDIPLPPQGLVIPQLPKPAPGLPTRQRLSQHAGVAPCNSCHDQIDPPGFALENYDMVGRFRTEDAGVAVDTSGTMSSATDVDGPFAQGTELLERIAHSADVKRCFAEHYLTFAVARDLAAEDGCALARLKTDFAASGNLKELIVKVATSDAFRLRTTEGPGAP